MCPGGAGPPPPEVLSPHPLSISNLLTSLHQAWPPQLGMFAAPWQCWPTAGYPLPLQQHVLHAHWPASAITYPRHWRNTFVLLSANHDGDHNATVSLLEWGLYRFMSHNSVKQLLILLLSAHIFIDISTPSASSREWGTSWPVAVGRRACGLHSFGSFQEHSEGLKTSFPEVSSEKETRKLAEYRTYSSLNSDLPRDYLHPSVCI